MIVDAKGLQCPQPVILTKKALETISSGELMVLVDNVTSKENVIRLVENAGYQFAVAEEEGIYEIKIVKTQKEDQELDDKADRVVIVIATDQLGQGSEALGYVLMKSFTYALTEVNPLPKSIVFLNSGAKLTVDGSPVLENLQKLYSVGVEIITCGTCLDFYEIKDQLRVGIIGNMYSIIEKQFEASKVIYIG